MTFPRFIGILCALAVWQSPAMAQSASVPLDGPVLSADADSLETHFNKGVSIMPVLDHPMAPYGMFSKLDAPMFETREQRALRLQSRAVASIMPSVRADLSQSFKPIPYQYIPLALLAQFFFTPQFSPPPGFHAMIGSSNPFIMAKIPGWAPESAGMYSPSVIPQAVELEYDFSTGTYRQKMVDWKVYEKRLNSINPSNFNITPVPRIPINDVERRIMDLGM